MWSLFRAEPGKSPVLFLIPAFENELSLFCVLHPLCSVLRPAGTQVL